MNQRIVVLENQNQSQYLLPEWRKRICESWQRVLGFDDLYTIDNSTQSAFECAGWDTQLLKIDSGNTPGLTSVPSIFDALERQGKDTAYCFIKSDLYLGSAIIDVLQRASQEEQFLIVGKGIVGEWREFAEGEDVYTFKSGQSNLPQTLDFFYCTPGMWSVIPDLNFEGENWADWFIYHAFRQGIPVFDISNIAFGLSVSKTLQNNAALYNTFAMDRDAAAFGKERSLRICLDDGANGFTERQTPFTLDFMDDLTGYPVTPVEEPTTKVVFYGIGATGRRALDLVKRHYDVVGLCDSNPNYWGLQFGDMTICRPEVIADLDYDFIIVAATAFKEVCNALVLNGVDARRIVHLPYLDEWNPPILDRYEFLQIQNKYFVYAWGKSASVTVRDTIAPGINGDLPCHFHYVTQESIDLVADVYRKFPLHLNRNMVEEQIHLTGQALPLKKLIEDEIEKVRNGTSPDKLRIVCSVREPIAWTVSMSMNRSHWFGIGPDIGEADKVFSIFSNWAQGIENWQTTFLDYQRDYTFQWFQTELEPVLGVKMEDLSFDFDAGYGYLENDAVEVIFVKVETLDRLSNALADKWQLNDLDLVHSNDSSLKFYGDLYKQVKEHIRFPRSFLERFYADSYAKYFYSDKEIEAYMRKWEKKS